MLLGLRRIVLLGDTVLGLGLRVGKLWVMGFRV